MKSTVVQIKTPAFFLLFLFFLMGCQQNEKPTLYLIGDSTMANKEKLYLPERGWGQALPTYFTDELLIENHAKNGRSTRSFIYQGRWDSVYKQLQPGDFVLIQFGHNDGSIQKTERYATPVEYQYNLNKFIDETRAKKAIPVLCTPIVRRKFDEEGKYMESHGEYPDLVRQVAKQANVPLLEMHLKSRDLLEKLGAEDSKSLYLHILPQTNDSLPDGLTDNTHFSDSGAHSMAKIAVDEIKEKVPLLAKYLK
ncbi:MAG: rhamnogalacturonan acetylesterase [Salinivirgaceae bacterium]|jgi:DNA sulfur modification protein DndE